MMRLSMMPVLLLAGCAADSGSEDKAAAPVALVALARADMGAITRQVTVFGTAESGAAGKQALTAPADALVVQIDAPVGTRVSRGDVIVRLAPAPTTRLDVAKASADSRAADTALARARRLRADGLVSDAEVETARAAATSADATRASLSGRLGALALRALAPGFVEAISVSPGEQVATGAAVAIIGRPGDTRARFGVDPAIARAIRPGTPVRITATTGRAAFSVPIESVSPAVDAQTRLASVYARLPASAGIGAGETVQATLDVGGTASGLTIPYAALLDDGGQPYVYVVRSNVAHRRDVRVGPATGDRVAIEGGISAGDLVVTQGGTALEDGVKVRTR